RGTAHATAKLAWGYYTEGRMDEAESQFRKAIETYEQLGETNTNVYAGAITGLAEIYMNEKRYGEAAVLFNKAADIVTSSDRKLGWRQVQVVRAAGDAYYAGKNWQQSINRYEQGMKIALDRNVSTVDVGLVLDGLTRSYARLGDKETAL